MPDRFTLLETFDHLAAHYSARPFAGEEWVEDYNIASGRMVPVVVEEPDGLELRLMQFGMVPFWAKDKKIAGSMINAPVETLKEKPGFRDSFKDKRCIVPASGFYVWQKLSTVKQPSYVTPKSGLFTFAGLWSRWVSPESVELESFAIVTCPANETVKPVADRMPLTLPKENWKAWMAKDTKPHELAALLASLPVPEVSMMRVSKHVNAAKSSGPKCIEAA